MKCIYNILIHKLVRIKRRFVWRSTQVYTNASHSYSSYITQFPVASCEAVQHSLTTLTPTDLFILKWPPTHESFNEDHSFQLWYLGQ